MPWKTAEPHVSMYLDEVVHARELSTFLCTMLIVKNAWVLRECHVIVSAIQSVSMVSAHQWNAILWTRVWPLRKQHRAVKDAIDIVETVFRSFLTIAWSAAPSLASTIF